MSEEPTFLAAPDEPIAIEAGRMRDVRARDLAIRFAFGAVTSIAAALISLAFGARAGGLLLAFPAILAASLTLIENEDSAADAREDARGAVVGAVALGAFAATGSALFTIVPGAVALAVASLAWATVAVGLYFLLWRRRPGRGRRTVGDRSALGGTRALE